MAWRFWLRIGACILLATFVLPISGCGSAPRPSQTPLQSPSQTDPLPGDGYKLHIFGDDCWDTRLLGYDLKGSWAVLSTLDLAASTITISLDDIYEYDWSNQALLLTEEATAHVKGVFATTPYLAISLEHACFVVTLNGRRLYGGIFLALGSAMGISFPVIYTHPEGVGRQVVWWIRPSHSISEESYPSKPQDYRNLIEVPALQSCLASHGKLATLNWDYVP